MACCSRRTKGNTWGILFPRGISKKPNLRSSACERPKAATMRGSVHATRPRLLRWPAAAPVIVGTAACSPRDWRHGARYVTGSHLLCLVFSCNTESNLHRSKECRGHGGKAVWYGRTSQLSTWHTCCVFRWFRLRISVPRPEILTQHRANNWIVSYWLIWFPLLCRE